MPDCTSRDKTSSPPCWLGRALALDDSYCVRLCFDRIIPLLVPHDTLLELDFHLDRRRPCLAFDLDLDFRRRAWYLVLDEGLFLHRRTSWRDDSAL